MGVGVYVWSLRFRGESAARRGQLDQARKELVHAVEAAREAGEAENLGWALSSCAYLDILSGAFDKATAYAAEALEVAEKLGNPFSQAHALREMAFVQTHQGLWKDAIESLHRALGLAREHRTAMEIEPELLIYLADSYRGDGQLERARETISQALALAEERGSRFQLLEARLVLARVLMDAEGAAAEAEAAEALDGARECVEEFEARVYTPRVLEERARLADLLRDEDSRIEHLSEAHRLYAEMGATGHAERLARELDL
jgi:tetratricopeptide (TPR) repeat protein